MLAGLPEVRRIDTFFGVTVREHGQQHATNSPCQCVAIGSCCDGFVETREANHWMSPKQTLFDSNARTAGGKKNGKLSGATRAMVLCSILFCFENGNVLVMLCFKDVCTTRPCAKSFCRTMFISQGTSFNRNVRLPPMWIGRCCVRCPGWAPKNQWCGGVLRNWQQPLVNLRRKTTSFRKYWLIELIGSCRLLVSCVHSYKIMNGN